MVSSYRQFANIMSTVQFWYRDYPPWNPKLASLLNKDPLPQSFRHCGPLLLPQWQLWIPLDCLEAETEKKKKEMGKKRFKKLGNFFCFLWALGFLFLFLGPELEPSPGALSIQDQFPLLVSGCPESRLGNTGGKRK